MLKDFERSDTDFHMYWFSTKFWREYRSEEGISTSKFLFSFLRNAGFTKLTKCTLYIVENSMKRLWIDVFNSSWQNFVNLIAFYVPKELYKIVETKWGEVSDKARDMESFRWGSQFVKVMSELVLSQPLLSLFFHWLFHMNLFDLTNDVS